MSAQSIPKRPQTAEPNEIGLSHIALVVRNVEESIEFYARYAGMTEVHRRRGRGGDQVVWLSDLSRPFAIVLIEADAVDARLEGIAHLGVGCRSREELERLCAMAREAGRLSLGPEQNDGPMGYWALLQDPDGHNLELSYGQRVAHAVGEARRQARAS